MFIQFKLKSRQHKAYCFGYRYDCWEGGSEMDILLVNSLKQMYQRSEVTRGILPQRFMDGYKLYWPLGGMPFEKFALQVTTAYFEKSYLWEIVNKHCRSTKCTGYVCRKSPDYVKDVATVVRVECKNSNMQNCSSLYELLGSCPFVIHHHPLHPPLCSHRHIRVE